ncbi:hypothetical protein Tdes44962_MAKER01970 [Teratosphaeria destructans]|uniref:Uncharacterized protein n=1 Tax=Teratosphaeria destructans TaxID=418781 RepID=A0A9W7W456_9PEZI|nr:hypothetical protein Tdes44962_MAKER01970 [Teratosphaeria destructans]
MPVAVRMQYFVRPARYALLSTPLYLAYGEVVTNRYICERAQQSEKQAVSRIATFWRGEQSGKPLVRYVASLIIMICRPSGASSLKYLANQDSASNILLTKI